MSDYNKKIFFGLIQGDETMFGDHADHYKYLTNEADLNNVVDNSIALTPRTPKRGVSSTFSRLVRLSKAKQSLQYFVTNKTCKYSLS